MSPTNSNITVYAQPSPEVTAVKQRLGIIGNAPALNSAVERAIRVAPIDLSVLITGQSGTGKEFFPKIIHQGSARKHNKYIAVNCGAIPEGTIDSELFGHEKGAFTGAVASRKGYFEEADGGTIFLDEVAELPLTTQARLLRVLESGEFIKVGSSTVQRTNIRIVAATNVDMQRAIAEGRFREDLYYRLSTVHINVPPLNERGNDIILLARKFIADFSERYRMPAVTLSDDARTRLLHYNWPGNVRQLKNVVDQMSLFEAGKEADAHTVDKYLPHYDGVTTPAPVNSTATYDREREAIFNLIFTLRKELDELKSEVRAVDRENDRSSMHRHRSYEEEAGGAGEQSHAVDTHDRSKPWRYFDPSFILPRPKSQVDESKEPVEVRPIEDTPATLEETERETIRRALERNQGKRKMAAQELNISERTLYRKIKEYGLD